MRCAALIVLTVSLYAPSFCQSDSLHNLLDAAHFKQLARALDINGQDPRTLFLLSRMRESLGEHEEALRLAKAAVKADPKKAIYHLQLASVMSDEVGSAGMFKKMSLSSRLRSELETALKLDPSNPDCLEGMMRYYEQAPGVAGGNKSKAQEIAREIARIDPSRGYLAQAYLAHANKQDDKVEGLYLQALKTDPKNVEALFALGAYYAKSHQRLP